ncbi:MAG: hypothetical protein WAN76_19690 [Candidatus Sulfotelmatobacter sp.]
MRKLTFHPLVETHKCVPECGMYTDKQVDALFEREFAPTLERVSEQMTHFFAARAALRERAVGRAVPIRASRARRANPEMVRQSRPVFEKPTHAKVIHHAPVVVTKVVNIRRPS